MTMNKETQELSKLTKVSRKELAELFNVSLTTISNFIDKGLPVGRGKSKLNLAESIQWFVKYEVEKALRSSKPEDKAELEMRKLRAQAIREEYKTAAIMNQTVTVDEAEQNINFHLERISNKVLSIPAVWASQLVRLKDESDVMDQLSDLVHAFMKELADMESTDEVEEVNERSDTDTDDE